MREANLVEPNHTEILFPSRQRDGGKAYYDNVVKIRAHTAGRARVYFMGRPCEGDKETLIVEASPAAVRRNRNHDAFPAGLAATK